LKERSGIEDITASLWAKEPHNPIAGDVGCCIQQLSVSDISLQQGIPRNLETQEYIL
jgi:hypothetical protein